ncbi:hypothetical protein MTR_1g052285 [Medicago truncatula]|uniref:Uncharacterized protein n=1 Tax=Medicago truncatula TaxID=3880 RepID=A0A072VJE4_MEDTR|nr:hypothetical protein MTR_1g052285 [Medicago truncatula]
MTRPPPTPNTATSNPATASGVETNPPVPPGVTQSSQTGTTTPVIEPVLTPTGNTTAAQTSQATLSNIMAAYTSRAIPATSMATQTSQTMGSASSQGFFNHGTGRRAPYGMPTSLMQNLQTSPSVSSESLNAPMPQLFNIGESIPFRTSQQPFIPFGLPQRSLTNASLSALRQQMEETNHEMVNLVTQHVGTVINPLIGDTNNSYQPLSLQMERIANFLGAPLVRVIPATQNANARQRENHVEEQVNQVPGSQAQEVQPAIPEEPVRAPIIVNRHQNADQGQVERLKAEKARRNRFPKKEKVAYVDTGDSDPEFDWGSDTVEDNEINLAELKDGPPYTCKLLRPSNGKNHEEPKNDKYPPKTYTFDVSKCEEIFDLLVTDGIILVPENMKLPPFERRKKRGFCKFHGVLGHNLSLCTRFRDSVHKALDEGRLKFGEKTKQPMQVDVEPSKKVDSICHRAVDNELPIGAQSLKETPPNDVEMVAEDHQFDDTMVTEDQFTENMKVAYLKVEEDLVDFLNRCKISNINAMLCPRCSAVFDKEAAKSIEGFQPQTKHKGGWTDNRPKFVFNKRGVPYKMKLTENLQSGNWKKTFSPPARSPTDAWVFSEGKKSGYSAPPTKWVKKMAPIPRQKDVGTKCVS